MDARIAFLLLLCTVALPAFTDSITIDGVAHEDILIQESPTRYYIQIPSDGRTISVLKSKVLPEDVTISQNAEAREALKTEWEQNKARREKTAEEDGAQVPESPVESPPPASSVPPAQTAGTRPAKSFSAGVAFPTEISDLLDAYAETQARVYASFHIKFTSRSDYTYWQGPNKTFHGSHEVWYDGHRHHLMRTVWGNTVPDPSVSIPKDDPQCSHWLWDGTHYFIYGHGHKRYWRENATHPEQVKNAALGRMSIVRDCSDAVRQGRHTDWSDYDVRGYVGGFTLRVDEILRQAREIRLRPTKETVSGSTCHVVDAVTPYGRYSVWFDREHGCNAAQWFITRGAGDLDYDRPLPHGASREYFLRRTRFRNVQNVWVPMAAETGHLWTEPDGTWKRNAAQYRRTHVKLAPEFSDDAFTPQLVNDSPAWLKWIHGNTSPNKTGCTWQDGKVIDTQRNVLFALDQRDTSR